MIPAYRNYIYVLCQSMNMYLFFAAFNLDQRLCYTINRTSVICFGIRCIDIVHLNSATVFSGET